MNTQEQTGMAATPRHRIGGDLVSRIASLTEMSRSLAVEASNARRGLLGSQSDTLKEVSNTKPDRPEPNGMNDTLHSHMEIMEVALSQISEELAQINQL